MLAFLSGVCFSGLALISRILPNEVSFSLLANPLVYALVIYCFLGLVFFTMAIQAGLVTRVYVIMFVTETVIPAGLGVGFLGDAPRDGLWPVMILGFSMAVASSVLLAASKDFTAENATAKTP